MNEKYNYIMDSANEYTRISYLLFTFVQMKKFPSYQTVDEKIFIYLLIKRKF